MSLRPLALILVPTGVLALTLAAWSTWQAWEHEQAADQADAACEGACYLGGGFGEHMDAKEAIMVAVLSGLVGVIGLTFGVLAWQPRQAVERPR